MSEEEASRRAGGEAESDEMGTVERAAQTALDL